MSIHVNSCHLISSHDVTISILPRGFKEDSDRIQRGFREDSEKIQREFREDSENIQSQQSQQENPEPGRG